MGPWLESIGALALAGLGVGAGLLAARLRKPWWTLGYFLPLALVVAIAASLRVRGLAFVPPVSWIASGRVRHAVLSFAVPAMFATVLPRLEGARRRLLAGAFAGVTAVLFGVMPFVAPALVRGELEEIGTTFDDAGVCLQQTGYTCGPAAAVTGLRALGLEADEGELAVLSRTAPLGGTQAENLCAALRRRYEADGLTCEYRSFGSVEELGACCPALAVVKFAPLVDHWVAVLEVTDDRVVVGDPARGFREIWHRDFEKLWRGTGIVLKCTRNGGTDEGGGP